MSAHFEGMGVLLSVSVFLFGHFSLMNQDLFEFWEGVYHQNTGIL
jgi:hypothetical protein